MMLKHSQHVLACNTEVPGGPCHSKLNHMQPLDSHLLLHIARYMQAWTAVGRRRFCSSWLHRHQQESLLMAATSTTVRLFDLRASQKAAASLRPHEQQPLVSSSPCSSSTRISHDLRTPRHV